MPKIRGVDCYGEVECDSNFHIVCEDEFYDGVWVEGNPTNTDDYSFKNWTEVVNYLLDNYRKDIQELSAV